jgi:uncharacterized protein (DUF302 family)
MIQQNTPYGLSTTIAADFTTAVSCAKAALAAEGFGVLAEMDIGAAMRDKLHVPFRDYVILGACMPALAHQAILAETDIGLLLPCNVIVYATRSCGRALPYRQPGNSPTGGAGEAAASPRARGRRPAVAIEIASKRQAGHRAAHCGRVHWTGAREPCLRGIQLQLRRGAIGIGSIVPGRHRRARHGARAKRTAVFESP